MDTDHGLYLLGGDVVHERRAHVAQRRVAAQAAVDRHLRRKHSRLTLFRAYSALRASIKQNQNDRGTQIENTYSLSRANAQTHSLYLNFLTNGEGDSDR